MEELDDTDEKGNDESDPRESSDEEDVNVYVRHTLNKWLYKCNTAVGIPIFVPHPLANLPLARKRTCDIRYILTYLNKPHRF